MKKLIFAFVFCCLAGVGYAQEFTVTKSQQGSFCYTDKKFEKQLDTSSPNSDKRVQRVGTYSTTPVQEMDTYTQQVADRLLTPEMRKMLKKLEKDQNSKFLIIVIFFDATGKAVTSQIMFSKEYTAFTEKYARELYSRALKEVFNEKIFRFYNDAELCAAPFALSMTRKQYNNGELPGKNIKK